MNQRLLTSFLAAAVVGSLSAQDAPALRYKIKTKSSVTTERQMLVDGEEMSGRGGRGFGGGGPTVTKATLIYDEGKKAGKTWRKYHTLEAVVTRSGRDGEPMDSTVKSMLAGKQITFGKDGVFAGEEKLTEQQSRGIPKVTDLTSIVPEGELKVDMELEITDAFRNALSTLVHPVRAERRGRGEGGEGQRRRRGGEGEGGGEGQRRRRGGGRGGDEGGEEGQRRRRGGGGEGDGEGQRRRRGGGGGGGEGDGQGQRRRRGGEGGEGQRRRRGGEGSQRGRSRFGRGRTTANDAAINLLANKKLAWEGKGRVASIEEKDGKTFATIEFTASAAGEGTIQEFGGGFGGRFGGRRGGGGGGNAPEGEASAKLRDLKGSMVVDVATRQMQKLELNGKMTSESETAMMRNMRGQEAELEIIQERSGSFSIEVTCEKADTTNDKNN